MCIEIQINYFACAKVLIQLGMRGFSSTLVMMIPISVVVISPGYYLVQFYHVCTYNLMFAMHYVQCGVMSYNYV